MIDQPTPSSQLLARLTRVVRAIEDENARLRAERELQRADIVLLRDQNARLERELAGERSARLERDDQLIDWLGQGRELLSEELRQERPHPPEGGLPPGQDMRAAVLRDIASAAKPERERLSTVDFARTYGGESPVSHGVGAKS